MTHEFNVKPSRRSGSLLGAVIVVFLGCLGSGVVVGALGGDPLYAIGVLLGGVVGIAFLLWLCTTAPVAGIGETLGWMFIRHRQEDNVYLPQPKQPAKQKFGTNAPPTPEDVRDLKEGGNTWVPSQTVSNRRPPSGK